MELERESDGPTLAKGNEELAKIIADEPEGTPKNGAPPLNRILFGFNKPGFSDPVTEEHRKKARAAAAKAPK